MKRIAWKYERKQKLASANIIVSFRCGADARGMEDAEIIPIRFGS